MRQGVVLLGTPRQRHDRYGSSSETLGPGEWHEYVHRVDFGEANDLIDRHNRWYPVETRLPLEPRTGDYALVNGERYTKHRLDARWVFDRFPSPAA